MSETQKFAKIDKLAEGLRGHGAELEAGTLKNTPEHKKWKSALNALPKKDQQEYKQQKYDESVKDREWQREQKLKKLFEKEIRPDTKVVWFWLGEKIVKEEKLLTEKEAMEDRLVSNKELDNHVVQNIGVPETIDIDYSEIKDIPVAKNGGPLRPYKDGFLIVRDENPKHYQYFEISDYLTNNQTDGGRMFFHSLNFKNNIHYYVRSNDVEKVAPYQKNLSFYFVFKRAYKNKAFKITLKNNKYLTHIFKLFKKRISPQENNIKAIVSTLPSRITINYIESLGILEKYEMYQEMEESTEKEGNARYGYKDVSLEYKKRILPFSNQQILKAGYYFSILSKYIMMIVATSGVLQKNKGEKFKDTILARFVDLNPKDFKALTQKMLEVIDDAGIIPKNIIPFVEKTITEGRNEKKRRNSRFTGLTKKYD